jgi:hypothetical protein
MYPIPADNPRLMVWLYHYIVCFIVGSVIGHLISFVPEAWIALIVLNVIVLTFLVNNTSRKMKNYESNH